MQPLGGEGHDPVINKQNMLTVASRGQQNQPAPAGAPCDPGATAVDVRAPGDQDRKEQSLKTVQLKWERRFGERDFLPSDDILP